MNSIINDMTLQKKLDQLSEKTWIEEVVMNKDDMRKMIMEDQDKVVWRKKAEEYEKALKEMIEACLSVALTSNNSSIRKMAEQVHRERERQKAVESAKQKLTPEELEALGIK